MTRKELLERLCPTAETCSCNIDNVGDCTFCNEIMNGFLDEYDKHIKAGLIARVTEEIVKNGSINITHINNITEQLKE